MKSLLIFPIVVALSVSGFLATDIYLPSFPRMVEYFQTNSGNIQLSLSLFVFAMALSQFIFGLLSDKYGRRPMLLKGIFIYIIGSLTLFNTTSITWLYVGRILQGLGIGAAVAISRIVLRDSFHDKQLAKIFSFVALVIVIAAAVSPYIGGIMQAYFDFYGSYVVMLAYGLVLLGLVIWVLPETNKHLDPHAIKLKYIAIRLQSYMREPKFPFSVLTNGAVFSMFLSYASISPFIFKHTFQMSAMVTGELLLLMASGLVLGMLVNSWLLRHFQPKQNIFIGLLLTLSINTVLLLLSALGSLNAIILVALFFCLNLGIALILPNNAAIIFSIFPTGAGLVGAVYGALRMLIAAMAGMVISALHLSTALQMSYLLLYLNFIAFGAYALTFLPRGKRYTRF